MVCLLFWRILFKPYTSCRTLLTNIYYCSYECLSGHRAPTFTSLLHTLPSNAGLSGKIRLREAKPATLIQMPETIRFQNEPHLPFDILLYILDYAQHSDLPALCRVSKTFHDCTSNIFYRDISAVNILDVCETLNRSSGLARRVKHFELTPASREKFLEVRSEYVIVGNALRSVTCLRSLKSFLLSYSIICTMLGLCTLFYN